MGKCVINSVLVIKLLALLTIIHSCQENHSCLRDGDLLFCIAENSAMSEAIVDATRTEKSVQYDHVAIYTHINDIPFVIEANPKHGVVCRPLSEFLKDTPDINDKKGVTVMRVMKPIDIYAAIERAKQFIGQPYDWSYRPHNGKMYCSELIYDCYLDSEGTPVFKASPMNFRNKEGDIPSFWSELFNKIGEEVPEGIPGTNPNDMFCEPILNEINCNFASNSID